MITIIIIIIIIIVCPPLITFEQILIFLTICTTIMSLQATSPL
jgi:hypothetical protein